MENKYLEKIASFRDEEQRGAGGYIGGAAVGAAAGGLGMEALRKKVAKPLTEASDRVGAAMNGVAEKRIAGGSGNLLNHAKKIDGMQSSLAKKLKMTRGMGAAGAIGGALAGAGIVSAMKKD